MAVFDVVAFNDVFILLVDLDRGRSITNDAPEVIEALAQMVGGIGKRAVYYMDTMGNIDRLLVRDERFDGYQPCTDSQRRMLARLIRNR